MEIKGDENQVKLGVSKAESMVQNMENVMNNQGGYGKLKFVSKTRNPVACRECKSSIIPGSECYMQSDYTGEELFPVQTRLCMKCAQIQIDKGVGIKVAKVKKASDKRND